MGMDTTMTMAMSTSTPNRSMSIETSPILDAARRNRIGRDFPPAGRSHKTENSALLPAGPRSVGEIVENLELSQTLVSHHLRLLRGARLVRGERRSKQVFYEVADSHVSDMLIDMAFHIHEDHADD